MKAVIRTFWICLIIVCFAFPELSNAEDFQFPLDGMWKVIQDFGVWNSKWNGYHLAEDAGAPVGTSVFASADGLVKFAGIVDGYSGVVIVEHKEVCTLYGHLSKALGLKVSAGQRVKKGDPLGYIANPAEYSDDKSMPSHVHFGIRKGSYTTEQFCGHWAYVGYTQECEGMTHKQYMAMWVDPSGHIESRMEPSTTFNPGNHAIVQPDIGLVLRDSHNLPADDNNKIAVMPKGSDVEILDHPDNGIPVDGYYWWYVKFGDRKGWCAESNYQRTEIFLVMVKPPKTEIKVENATVVWEAEMTRSAELAKAASVVSPRIIVEYADTLYSKGLVAAKQLAEVAKSVLPRIVVEYAGTLSSFNFQKPEDIQGIANTVSPRIVVEYGDTLYTTDLVRFPMSSPPAARRTLSIASAEVPPGGSAKVMINVTEANGITSGDILIKYDANVITINDVKSSDLTSKMSLVVNKDTAGQVKISMAGLSEIPSGSGTLLEIDLTVNAKAQPNTQTGLQFGDAVLYDSSGRAIPTILVNSTIKVAEPAGIKGDVNSDGKVDSRDALMALRFSVGLATPTDKELFAADMNGDGKIRANDVTLILRKAAGLGAPSKDVIAKTGNRITISLDEVHGVAGESVTIPLKADNVAELGSGDISIVYDSSMLRAVSISPSYGVVMVSNTTKAGLIRLAFANAHKLSSKALAQIKFDVLADKASPITIQMAELYNHDAIPINSGKVNGRFSSWAMRPERSALLQNFPNPFNPDTWIPYQLKDGSDVLIRIYSDSGMLVRELRLGYKSAGLYVSRDRSAYWDGKNEAGEKIASGVYFYNIHAGNFNETRKMTVMK